MTWARWGGRGGWPPVWLLHFPFLSGSGHPANECHLQQEELWVTLRSLQCGLCCRCTLPESLPCTCCGCAWGLSFLHSGTGCPTGMTSMPHMRCSDCCFQCKPSRNPKTGTQLIVTPVRTDPLNEEQMGMATGWTSHRILQAKVWSSNLRTARELPSEYFK